MIVASGGSPPSAEMSMCALVGRSSSTAPDPTRKSPPTRRKTLAGCPFELGVRAIVAKEREGMWVEERKRPPLKICFYSLIYTIQGNKSLTAAGAHIPSLRNAHT
ncbi:hypothetical protein [Paenibacillus eucommiae]|uniref:Uncharacterized protein n=1 Tax=Paenibacillus eucommiae TaxID=1355755 RepID=A0ABS4IR60_9BACL|nr:hypothetical protein [Paenibacillus eucommiae]MBP1990052.1 hypothetical protein [Paenibacillus eucommiae]